MKTYLYEKIQKNERSMRRKHSNFIVTRAAGANSGVAIDQTPFIMKRHKLVEAEEEAFNNGVLRAFSVPQSAPRKAIREAFKTAGEFSFIYDYSEKQFVVGGYHELNAPTPYIRFGCRSFAGLDYKKLRRWALRKS